MMKKVLHIGSVGTSSIMKVIQEGIRLTDGLETKVIYSRDMERGRAFAGSAGVEECCDDYEAMIAREDLDIIYIASPNCFHAQQAVRALERGKHVIVEKPAAVSGGELREMEAAARQNGVFFFEAITTLFMPNYTVCRNMLPRLGRLTGADICFGRYSSKYDDYLAGKNPNIFNPEMKAGALNDMGIYCIHMAVDLFGAPQQVSYEAEYGPNGIDLCGTLLLEYPELVCRITTSKDRDLKCGFRLEGENGFLASEGELNVFPACYGEIGGASVTINEPTGENRMVHELARFRDAILNCDTEFFDRMCRQSREAAEILERAHQN
ncbi:MAG: Gfo/Idh/MocA family oxidoreductase [Lachnospiraceae bacterium]|nr:Gfo/Idh/MocA family oxidoreductase [Lachnospiraceae bacterium]